jgi:chromate transport protein ChrA
MHRDLVERRGWISESDYKEGLALAQIAPGPLAAQLGIYLGFVHFRLLGATVAGLALVLPSITERSAACATKPVASKAINAVKRMKLIICAFS